ncbi:DUF5693 family protein [Candidatus Riflebacteria bacterium]
MFNFQEVERLSTKLGLSIFQIIRKFGQYGIHSFVFEEDSLDALFKRNEIKKIGFDEPLYRGVLKSHFTNLYSKNLILLKRLQKAYAWHRPETFSQLSSTADGGYILQVLGSGKEFESEKLFGFSREYIKSIQKTGASVVLCLPRDFSNRQKILDFLARVHDLKNIESFFFRNDLTIKEKDETLLQKGLSRIGRSFSLIEFRPQSGVKNFYLGFPEKVNRAHCITPEEMNIYSSKKIKNRWSRAFKERKIQFGEIRLFFKYQEKEKDNLFEINDKYLKGVSNELRRLNFNLKKSLSKPRLPWTADKNKIWRQLFFIWLSGIATLACIHLLFPLTFEILVLYIFSFLSLFLLSLCKNPDYFKIPYSLLLTISGPLLAIYSLNFYKNKNFLLRILCFIFPTFLFSLIISALFSEPVYWLKLKQFRGVKISFLLPLFFLAYMQRQVFWNKVREFLKNPLEPQKLTFLSVGLIFVIYYLIRSGNYQSFGPSLMEEKFRDLLEWILYARPRTKEFLIGYPALFTFLYLCHVKKASLENSFFLPLFMLLGQISFINSFCHFHTPINITLLRCMNGILLGAIVSILWITFFELVDIQKEYFNTSKKNIFLLGYFGMGNLGDNLILSGLINRFGQQNARFFSPAPNIPELFVSKGEVLSIPRFHPIKLVLAILSCQDLIVGGGGIFQDRSSSLSFYYYICITFLADLFGLKMYHYGQSFSPLKNVLHEKLLYWVLKENQVIECRDLTSKKYLTNIGIPEASIKVTNDLAFFSPIVSQIPERKEDTLIVVIRPFMENAWLEPLLNFLHTLEYEFKIKFLSFHPYFDEDLNNNLKKQGFEVVSYHEGEEKEFLAQFGEASYLIGMRLHSLILAMQMGIPFIALSYDEKIDGILQDHGYDLFYDLKGGIPKIEELNSLMEKCIKYRHKISLKLQQATWEERKITQNSDKKVNLINPLKKSMI